MNWKVFLSCCLCLTLCGCSFKEQAPISSASTEQNSVTEEMSLEAQTDESESTSISATTPTEEETSAEAAKKDQTVYTADELAAMVETVDYRTTRTDARGAISADTAAAASKLIIDYLLADREGIDENPLIWDDVDALYQSDAEQGETWLRILTAWDLASEEGFVFELPEDDSLCFVVLGYQLNADGSMTKELIGRLDVALEYANRYPNSYLLVSGGMTSCVASEAQQMSEYLIANGVKSERILVEAESLTTIDNGIYSYRLLETCPTIQSIVVITSDYHLTSGTMLFQEQCAIAGDRVQVIGAIPYESKRTVTISAKTRAEWLINLYYRQ